MSDESQQFDTKHLHGDLRGRSVRGSAVTMGGQGAKFVLQLGSTAILARLLIPEDFGLFAMVTAITGLILVLKDMGLTMATVQRENISHEQVSTLFWVNLGVSVVLATLTGLAAPVVASFYGDPRLESITVVIALTFIAGGIAAQHQAILRRQMRFGTIAAIEVASMATGIALAVGVALAGGGYWALVALAVGREVVQSLATWRASGWTPGLPRRRSGVAPMLAFGANLSGFSIVNYVGRNIDDVLIGWRWGPDAAGVYNRAYSLLMLPLRQINQPVTAVAVPVLSRLQDDPERYRRYYCRALNLLTYATVPGVALMGALSHEVVGIVLGPGWEEAGAVFAILAIAAVGQPVFSTAGWIWISLGRTDRMLRWALISDPIYVLAFFAGLPWGPRGVAIAYAVAVNVVLLPGLAYAYRLAPVRMRDAWGAVWGPGVVGACALVGALAGRALLADAALPLRAAAAGSLGIVAGLAVAMAWPAIRREVFGMRNLLADLRGRSSDTLG